MTLAQNRPTVRAAHRFQAYRTSTVIRKGTVGILLDSQATEAGRVLHLVRWPSGIETWLRPGWLDGLPASSNFVESVQTPEPSKHEHNDYGWCATCDEPVHNCHE